MLAAQPNQKLPGAQCAFCVLIMTHCTSHRRHKMQGIEKRYGTGQEMSDLNLPQRNPHGWINARPVCAAMPKRGGGKRSGLGRRKQTYTNPRPSNGWM